MRPSQDHPAVTWLVGDLSRLDLEARGIPELFDAIVCAGNVLPFAAPSTRQDVLRGFARTCVPGGRAIVGFGTDRGYAVPEFRAHAAGAGFQPELLLPPGTCVPWSEGGDFIVAILRRAEVAAG
jgi:SAM-dependent methyltransferase